MTLVPDRESIPPFDALFATYFTGAPPIAEPRHEGESEAPPNQSGELQPVLLGEGTGKSASVHDLRNRRTLRRHAATTSPNSARRSPSTSRRCAAGG